MWLQCLQVEGSCRDSNFCWGFLCGCRIAGGRVLWNVRQRSLLYGCFRFLNVADAGNGWYILRMSLSLRLWILQGFQLLLEFPCGCSGFRTSGCGFSIVLLSSYFY